MWCSGCVEAVPGQLLGQEARDPRLAHQLRQLGGVAEDVRVPELRAAAAELGLEEALAVEELARQRLPGRQVAVGLDPGAADRDPAAGGDGLAHPRVERRGAVAQPRVVLGLRVGEDVLGVVVEQPQLGGRGADELAVGLLERPQPGRVEVGMADRRDLVQRARGPREQRVERRAVDRVPVQAREQLAGPVGLGRRPPARAGTRGRGSAPTARRRAPRARSAAAGTPSPALGRTRRSRTGRCRPARARAPAHRRAPARTSAAAAAPS